MAEKGRVEKKCALSLSRAYEIKDEPHDLSHATCRQESVALHYSGFLWTSKPFHVYLNYPGKTSAWLTMVYFGKLCHNHALFIIATEFVATCNHRFVKWHLRSTMVKPMVDHG